MNVARPEPVITLFVESRAHRGADGQCRSTDRGVAGHAWQDELRERDGLRLALRVDSRPPMDADGRAAGLPLEGDVIALPHYVGLPAMLRRLPALVSAIDAAVKTSDVVCVKLPGLIGLIAVARARRRNKPVAVHVVGDIAEVLGAGVAGRLGKVLAPVAANLTRRAVRQGRLVRYVTERVLQERYPPAPSAALVVYSDVRLDSLTVAAPGSNVPGRIIAVGTQEQPYKGHNILIEAVAVLAQTDPRIHLELIGDGRYQSRLRELAEARRIGDRVHFVGHLLDRGELIARLDRADVFAMPSLTEGLPRALIEAMARGLPCIGSAVGGIPELLPPAGLVSAGDADALARLLRRALDDDAFRASLRGAAIETIERFRPDVLEARRREWSDGFDRLRRSPAAVVL